MAHLCKHSMLGCVCESCHSDGLMLCVDSLCKIVVEKSNLCNHDSIHDKDAYVCKFLIRARYFVLHELSQV